MNLTYDDAGLRREVMRVRQVAEAYTTHPLLQSDPDVVSVIIDQHRRRLAHLFRQHSNTTPYRAYNIASSVTRVSRFLTRSEVCAPETTHLHGPALLQLSRRRGHVCLPARVTKHQPQPTTLCVDFETR